MKCWKSAATLSAFALGLMLLPAAKADQWNELTRVRFSQPVEAPGVVLPAGTYMFKLLDSQTNRHIVQIFNKDQNHCYATILAIPDYRLHPSGKTVITFEERAAGSPPAIRAWFYPGDNFGSEFVYPKARAVALAKAVNQPVLSMPAETAKNITKPITSAKAPEVAQMENAPIMRQQSNGQETPMVQTQPAPSQRLPKTASNLPLTGLLGMVFFGFAGVLRFARKNAA
jgi:hypothetical protein